MVQSTKPTIACAKCGYRRPPFTLGTVDDHCPNCGYKEGCCD